MASDYTGEISDVEFEEWYRQQLNEYGIKDKEYREIIGTGLLSERMQAYLAEQVPYEAEQVHLHIIMMGDYEEALAVKERLDAGEAFAEVAREVSIDATTAENGGDIGWMPTKISSFEAQIELLEINEISAVMPYYSSTYDTSSSTSTDPDFYYILMVSEKDDSRELTEEYRAVIQAQALDFWLTSEISNHDIVYDFNSEMYAWLNWQLSKSTSDDE
jgi:parvulin-like peptidyl-prolyl isomerase